jgi:hypothetical protein
MKTQKIQALRNEMKMIQENFLNREILTERENNIQQIHFNFGVYNGGIEAFKKGY